MNDVVLSFKDCPNKCIDGYYFDPYTHNKCKCLYCEDKRKSVARGKEEVTGVGDIKKLLNLPDSVVHHGIFDITTVIPLSLSKNYTETSYENVKSELKRLIDGVSAGVAPEESLLFNLGLNASPCNYIYLYLSRAYMSGMTVSPFVTARDVYLLLEKESQGNNEDTEIVYKDLLKTDICTVYINTGALYTHIRSVKGLMQMRAHNGKSTLVFTDMWGNSNTEIKSERYIKITLESLYMQDNSLSSKSIARLISVERKKYQGNGGRVPVEMSAQDYEKMFRG